jgi:hypothetical protein
VGPGLGPGRRSFSISRILSPFFYNCFFSIFVSGIPLITNNQRRVAAWPGDCGTLFLAVFLSRGFSLVPNSCPDITQDSSKYRHNV